MTPTNVDKPKGMVRTYLVCFRCLSEGRSQRLDRNLACMTYDCVIHGRVLTDEFLYDNLMRVCFA